MTLLILLWSRINMVRFFAQYHNPARDFIHAKDDSFQIPRDCSLPLPQLKRSSWLKGKYGERSRRRSLHRVGEVFDRHQIRDDVE